MEETYQDLANAIVLSAVKDYRKALRKLGWFPDDRFAMGEKNGIEHFFRSGYFGILTNLDPEMLIEKLNQYKTTYKGGANK